MDVAKPISMSLSWVDQGWLAWARVGPQH
jgi:hypothetical protein